MAVKVLCLCLLLGLLSPSWAEQQTCLTSASNCDECIHSGPQCAWCSTLHSHIRCHTLKGLRSAGCPTAYVYNPQGGVQVVKNDSSSEPENAKAMFLQPQEVTLHLRPGVSQSFPLTITMPTDHQPITELTMDTGPVPAGVNITFSSVTDGNPLLVQVNVEAARCPSESDGSSQMQNRTGPWSVHITPRGFSLSVKLELTLACKCDCISDREVNSPSCSGNGALVCGQCECYHNYVGQQCQREADSILSPIKDACRSGPNAPVCSGRGKCVEDSCECDKRVNPKEKYSGQFCECSNFDCPHHNNRICGGHGRCECGFCVCDPDWTGEDCSCSMDTASCMAKNGQVCNDRGMCICGTCVCDSNYMGPTCEICPSCPGTCQRHVDCVECKAYGTGRKKDRCDQECGHLNVTMVETVHDLPELGEFVGVFCRMSTYDDRCWFDYTLSITPSGGQSIVVRDQRCSQY